MGILSGIIRALLIVEILLNLVGIRQFLKIKRMKKDLNTLVYQYKNYDFYLIASDTFSKFDVTKHLLKISSEIETKYYKFEFKSKDELREQIYQFTDVVLLRVATLKEFYYFLWHFPWFCTFYKMENEINEIIDEMIE